MYTIGSNLQFAFKPFTTLPYSAYITTKSNNHFVGRYQQLVEKYFATCVQITKGGIKYGSI